MSGRDQPPAHSSSPPPGDEPHGVRATISSFSAGLRQYLEARGELLAIESREAASFAGRQGLLGTILAGAGVIAYLLLLVAIVSLAGHWLGTILPGKWSQFGWQTSAIIAALLHLGIAAACFRTLRKHPTPPLFEVTREEFQKDSQWLQHQQTKTGRRS